MPLEARTRTFRVCSLSLQHSSSLTAFFLDRKPRSHEHEEQSLPLLFGPKSGCQWLSCSFHLCPAAAWAVPPVGGGACHLRKPAGILSPQVTCRALGIGAYLVRLGQRVIQVENSHIILTGASALNKVTAKGPVWAQGVILTFPLSPDGGFFST